MNLIDRYIYAVTRRLSAKQKSDIEKELRTLIDDMLEQYEGDESNDSKVQKVLLELGDPAILADSYRETKRYLIGPQNFDNYLFVLKIVMGAVLLGISISTAIGSFFNSGDGIINILASYLAVLLSALMQAFAWVTAAFAIAEYNGVNLLDKKDINDGWSIAELPEPPQKEAIISRAETIFSILFSTIFISVLFFAPHIFAAYINNGSSATIVIPVFNVEVLSRFKMLLVVLLILGLIKEVLKLYYGRWTLRLSIPLTILSIASAIISVSIFANPRVWNASFSLEVMRHLDVNIADIGFWSSLGNGIVIIIILATLVEIATSLYKGIKYNK